MKKIKMKIKERRVRGWSNLIMVFELTLGTFNMGTVATRLSELKNWCFCAKFN